MCYNSFKIKEKVEKCFQKELKSREFEKKSNKIVDNVIKTIKNS